MINQNNQTKLEEDDIVLCTVKRIEGTTVFLDIAEDGEGAMVFSEVAAGRIRNIREFVSPGRKIVCKILRIKEGHPELSLRRVTAKERDEVLEASKKEQILQNMMKPFLKEKTLSVLQKIKQKYELSDFLDQARDDPKIIEPFISKSEAESLIKVFSEKREKEKEVKSIIIIKSNAENGIEKIKSVLVANKADISYLGSSKFSVSVKANDFKKANSILNEVLEEIKSKAKLNKVIFEIKNQ